MQHEILVVGSINLDMVVRSPRIPGPGENVCGAEFRMVPGGKGANQAVAARRLGSPTTLLGCLGTDFFAGFLLERLEAAGIDTSLVRRTGERPTGVALIVVEESTGVNTIVVDRGANMALSVEDLDALEGCYQGASAALFQLEIPTEVVREGARRAREQGVTAILDAGPPRGVDLPFLKGFDVVSPNRDELSDIAGEAVADVEGAERASRRLIGEGIPTVVVKMGGEGSVLVTGDGSWHVPAFEVETVDTTAAGDAFTAALATALGDGMELLDAVRFANAAGAVAVTVLGAQPSMPERGQVEALIDSQVVECTSL